MKRRDALLAISASFLAGFIAKTVLSNRQLSPEAALEAAKETFKKSGPISGSWIYMTPETLEKDGLSFTVYRGGISRQIDDKNVDYVFYTDIDTGSIVDVKSVS